MSAELLEIEPRELKFLFELKKQSSCSVRLVNKTNQHVAFKVKTTSPKKYCVRPNTGIVKPKSICDFIVTMQAQRVTPPDMICKDKFLLQCAIVPVGTTEEDVTSATFSKDDGKYVEEKKLRVILVSPPNSPILSPINGTLKQVPAYEASTLKDHHLNYVENFSPSETVIEDVMVTKIENAELLEPLKNDNAEELEPAKNVEHKTLDDVEAKVRKEEEELKLVKDIEEVKSKLKEFELKLGEAEVTISKLTEEKRLSTHDKEMLQQELAVMRTKTSVRRVQAGFPLLFVCMVALVSVLFGYLLHRP